VIKMEKFLISKGPYAVDLDSFKAEWHETRWNGEPPPNARKGTWHCTVDAVWFRRRRRETVACIGTIWDICTEAPADVHEFLKGHNDGRYGGNTEGRWDGASYWGTGTLEEQQEHLKILRPMLENYPAVPPSYDGWWRF
jgi:hypothetical protein